MQTRRLRRSSRLFKLRKHGSQQSWRPGHHLGSGMYRSDDNTRTALHTPSLMNAMCFSMEVNEVCTIVVWRLSAEMCGVHGVSGFEKLLQHMQ